MTAQAELKKTIEMKAEEIDKCSAIGGWEYFIFDSGHVYTFDKQAGGRKQFGQFNDSWDNPLFVEDIKDVIRKIDEKRRLGRKITDKDLKLKRVPKFDILIEKSRQLFMTWAIMAYITWCLLFVPGFRGLITSEKEKKMDSDGDYNTPFGKIDYIISNLPPHLKPKDSDSRRKYLRAGLHSIDTIITGDAGVNPGRGEQVDLIFNDELAHQEHTERKKASQIEACKGVTIDNSTPYGKNNSFYKTRQRAIEEPEDSSVEVVRLHWTQRIKPEYHSEFRRKKLREYNGDEEMFAQEQEISYEGSVKGRAFKKFISAEHTIPAYNQDKDGVLFIDKVRKHVKKSMVYNGLDYGFAHRTGAIWITHFGTQWLVFRDYQVQETPIPVHAEEFNRINAEWGIAKNRCLWFGDPAGEQRNVLSEHSDDTASARYAEHGIEIIQANNSVKMGIEKINGMFYRSELVILDTCTGIIDALNEAQYHINTNGEPVGEKYKEAWYTDIIDALRYAVMSMEKAHEARTGRVAQSPQNYQTGMTFRAGSGRK